jgi:hypothetical protein
MSITLGGVTLNDHVSWRGRFNQSLGSGSEQQTLGGRLVVTRGPEGSNDIVLEAIEEDNIRKGYFTQSQLESLEPFRISGQTITLNYHGLYIDVVIKINGISVEKTLWQSQYTADERYIGSITLARK